MNRASVGSGWEKLMKLTDDLYLTEKDRPAGEFHDVTSDRGGMLLEAGER